MKMENITLRVGIEPYASVLTITPPWCQYLPTPTCLSGPLPGRLVQSTAHATWQTVHAPKCFHNNTYVVSDSGDSDASSGDWFHYYLHRHYIHVRLADTRLVVGFYFSITTYRDEPQFRIDSVLTYLLTSDWTLLGSDKCQFYSLWLDSKLWWVKPKT